MEGREMIHKIVDWKTLVEFLPGDLSFILLKGYSEHNKEVDEARRYKTAKIPHSFRKGGTIPIPASAVDGNIKLDHWVGMKIPQGYCLVDCDDKDVGKTIATALMNNNVKTVVFETHNGYQFLFKDSAGKVTKQRVKQITLGGVIVDYRIAPNGYTVLPTPNIPERSIYMPDATELDELLDVFLPVRGAKETEADKLAIPIFEGERDQTFIAHSCRLNNYHAQYRMDFDVVGVLHQINDLFVEPRLETSDIERIYRSSLRYPTPDPLPELHPKIEAIEANDSLRDQPYYLTPEGHICRLKRMDGQTTLVRLANFDARIVREILEDNGIEQIIKYAITGQMNTVKLPEIEVPAALFPSMNWISQWGAKAVLEPGQGTKDHVRHAIQVRSNAQSIVSYAHTGWRKIEDQWVYLSQSGAIGMPNVTVKLPREVQRYSLPLEFTINERDAIQTSMQFLSVAKKEISIPLYAMLWLSTLTTILKPMPNFSGLSYGVSGSYKSTVALLLLSHFGEFPDLHAMSNFNDTANQLTERAFKLKDALMVVDDYHPEPSRKNSEDKEKILQRILRDFSNRTGRGRLNSDSTEKERHEPRSFLLVTAEELPRVLSTIARTLVLEFRRGDVDTQMLTSLQEKAHLLPQAMTSWLKWVSLHMTEIKESFPREFRELRTKASKVDLHHKLPEQVAYLQYTMSLVSKWMQDKGVLNEASAGLLLEISWKVLTGNISRQSEIVQDEDPVNIFMETLETLISQEKVRIDHRLTDNFVIGDVRADLIGFIDNELEWLHLIPGGLWNVIMRYLTAEGSHFPVSKNTLFKMLKERGLTNVDTDSGSSVVKVKENEGKPKSKRVSQLRITERIREVILQKSPLLQPFDK